MGTVYLARTDTGRLVAVKMIRTDLGPDREFRRRFRSEVNRARQVPGFCTAEVLDADPDHEPPYLVVEYVDGPSLAAVVQEQGPLTPANLQGVAIGVATALTAIHGAGVIHRDLKPTNVLLAPGSPKVIDFGIARAMEPTSHHTGTNQMLGTVAYMAPERFGSAAGTELTSAADVFAWGAVVAYAGSGRTPFHAENGPLMAVRILTEPPDLTGLVSPLRELVERALAKDPADRPSARQLLELMLTSGPARTPALAAALADQPALRLAAQEAQAATDHGPDGAVTAPVPADQHLRRGHRRQSEAPESEPGSGPSEADTTVPLPVLRQERVPGGPPPMRPGGYPLTGRPVQRTAEGPSQRTAERPSQRTAERPSQRTIEGASQGTARVPAQRTAGVPSWTRGVGSPPPAAAGISPVVTGAGSSPAGWQGGSPGGSPAGRAGGSPGGWPGGWRWSRVGLAVLTVAALFSALTLAGILTGWIRLPRDAGQPPDDGSLTEVGSDIVVSDALTTERLWPARVDATHQTSCAIDDGLVVTRQRSGTYRCPGPLDVVQDFTASVDVRLLTRGSCAGVWFRYSATSGYALRICAEGYYLTTHGVGDPARITTLRTMPFTEPIAGNTPARVGITVRGDTITLHRDEVEVETVRDRTFTSGRVALGIFQEPTPEPAPYRVAFNNIDIRT